MMSLARLNVWTICAQIYRSAVPCRDLAARRSTNEGPSFWALVIAPTSNGLVHLMGNQGRQLPHRRHAICVRELHLRLTVSSLALPQRSPSARFRSVKSSTKATPSSRFPPPTMPLTPTRTGTRLPSLRKYSFSKGLQIPVDTSSDSALFVRPYPTREASASVQRARP